MSKSLWKVLVNFKELVPVLAFGAVVLYFAFIILGIPVVYEVLKTLYQCQIGDCNRIGDIISISGTFFVIITLIITILSLVSSNTKYQIQLSKMDSQHYDQMNLMSSQVQLVIQSNRMAIIKEYLISLMINKDIDNGIMIDSTIGVICEWNPFMLGHDILTFKFKFYFPKSESADDILEDKNWNDRTIVLKQIGDGSYVMSGYSSIGNVYISIEKVFHDMSNNDYDNIVKKILILTFSNKDDFKKYTEDLEKYRKQWN